MQLEIVKIAFTNFSTKGIFLRNPISLNNTASYHFCCQVSTTQFDHLCEIPRPHPDTAHSAGLLCTSDRPVAQIST